MRSARRDRADFPRFDDVTNPLNKIIEAAGRRVNATLSRVGESLCEPLLELGLRLAEASPSRRDGPVSALEVVQRGPLIAVDAKEPVEVRRPENLFDHGREFANPHLAPGRVDPALEENQLAEQGA